MYVMQIMMPQKINFMKTTKGSDIFVTCPDSILIWLGLDRD